MPSGSSGSTGAVKVQGKDDGCCGIFFLKYVIFLFNFLFWLSGCALIGIGIWTIIDKHSYISLLNNGTYAATTYMLLATGAIIIVVGVIGCVGALKENRLCLMIYAGCLLLVFLLEAVAGILAYIYQGTIEEDLARSLNFTMLHNYKLDESKTLAIDDLQRTFKCCGAGSFKDWESSRWLKGTTNITNKTPDSCCKTESLGCAARDHPSNIYYEGCFKELGRFLKEHLIIIGSVGLGLCCLQIFGIIFACLLAKRIKEWNERAKTASW